MHNNSRERAATSTAESVRAERNAGAHRLACLGPSGLQQCRTPIWLATNDEWTYPPDAPNAGVRTENHLREG